MEKTEMLKRFEEETGQTLEEAKERWKTFDFYLKYIQWLEAKATAYDRLMSGGKKTLKEWANLLGMCVGVHPEPAMVVFAGYTEPIETSKGLLLRGNPSIIIPISLIDFGDRKASITLPDGWEEK